MKKIILSGLLLVPTVGLCSSYEGFQYKFPPLRVDQDEMQQLKDDVARFAKTIAADKQRIRELEDALENAFVHQTAITVRDSEIRRLEAELEDALKQLKQCQRDRQ